MNPTFPQPIFSKKNIKVHHHNNHEMNPTFPQPIFSKNDMKVQHHDNYEKNSTRSVEKSNVEEQESSGVHRKRRKIKKGHRHQRVPRDSTLTEFHNSPSRKSSKFLKKKKVTEKESIFSESNIF